jgi:uncharacterized protein YcsI (UPF0317 family)
MQAIGVLAAGTVVGATRKGPGVPVYLRCICCRPASLMQGWKVRSLHVLPCPEEIPCLTRRRASLRSRIRS